MAVKANQQFDDFDSAVAGLLETGELTRKDVLDYVNLAKSGLAVTHVPVGVGEFLMSPHYMGAGDVLYPVVVKSISDLNTGGYDEAVLTGGIGSGKTTIALYTQAYQLYLLSLYENPHAEFGLDPASEILFIFQSINATLAKSVDFYRFRAMLDKSPYFCRYFQYDRDILSELRFPHRITVKPIIGLETGAIGQNVISGVLDEVNFMDVVRASKRGFGEEYNQATALYNAIARRRESRFLAPTGLPGVLCVVSSKRYPGQFTDVKQAEAKTNPRIYSYDKCIWDIRPENFSGETFSVFVGDTARRPLILKEGETIDAALEVTVPVEFRPQFENDLLNALRDIAGQSTLASHPYLVNVEAVRACFSMGTEGSVFGSASVDFVDTMLTIYPGRALHPEALRFAHIDLAVTGDSCGLVIGHVEKFVSKKRGETTEILPLVCIDGILEIRPPRNGEIEFEKVRQVLYKLRDAGMPIKWVTMDSFQSRDTMQILSQSGFMTGYQSVDKTMFPYDVLKTTLYDNRLRAPVHEKVVGELLGLEVNTKAHKIDHPPQGSKDVSDALAGVVYGLTMRREVWVSHEVPLSMVPAWLNEKYGTIKGSLEAQETSVGFDES